MGGRLSVMPVAWSLREVEKRTGILQQFAGLFSDGRDPARVEHSCSQLLAQRIYALAPGYEDLNDHDQLREDLLPATLVEKEDPTGQQRRCRQDQGKALAGKSTLNRLELYEARGSVQKDPGGRGSGSTIFRASVSGQFPGTP